MASSRSVKPRSACGATLSRPDGEAAIMRLKGGAKKNKVPDEYAVRAHALIPASARISVLCASVFPELRTHRPGQW